MCTKKNDGCLSCIQYRSEHRMLPNMKPAGIKECLSGNNEVMVKWWADNGSKKTSQEEVVDSLDCHQESEASKNLSDMVEAAHELLMLLRECDDKQEDN